MSKVEAYKNWFCDIDRLDEIDLKEGEDLELTFPDGTVERVQVLLHSEKQTYTDHGHTYSMTVSKAYFTLDYHGWEMDCPLEGLEAKRI